LRGAGGGGAEGAGGGGAEGAGDSGAEHAGDSGAQGAGDSGAQGAGAGFFDTDYLRLLEPFYSEAQAREEIAALRDVLALSQEDRILDLGCGWGRHTALLAGAGHRVIGVDLSLPLLASARASMPEAGAGPGTGQALHGTDRTLHGTDQTLHVTDRTPHGTDRTPHGTDPAPHGTDPAPHGTDPAPHGTDPAPLVAGDMRALPFPDRTFDVLLNLATSLGLFLEDQPVLGALIEARRVLRPQGRLVLEDMNRDDVVARYATRDAWTLDDGTRVRARRRFDAVRGISHEVLRWDEPASGPTSRRRSKRHSLRLRSATELVRLVREAGLTVDWTAGGWWGEPFRHDSDRLIVMARRAG
jgi:SAM-dependent methyltransferase